MCLRKNYVCEITKSALIWNALVRLIVHSTQRKIEEDIPKENFIFVLIVRSSLLR